MSSMVTIPRIVSDPAVMGGKPVIEGTRITVEIVLRRIKDGYTVADMVEDWPHVAAEDIHAAIDFAVASLPRPQPEPV